jgi:2-succinyl-5-enolpyruvyl-6-hydroxy-3-cyclohexene-1-carboxylate synthase
LQSGLSVYQTNINTIVSTLYSKGLRHAVICPGSRNAPLIMAFARFGKISCYSVADERAAGFMALGMGKQLKQPVAVICTSGTAVLNLYPAVAEAYYMQVPLLMITADRPAELIGRWDGQTIMQFEVFKPHVLGSFQTPENLDENLSNIISKISADAYDVSVGSIHGPVHLNVPLKEPLYEAARLEFAYPEIPLAAEKESAKLQPEINIAAQSFTRESKVMILLGAGHPGGHDEHLQGISNSRSAVVIADVISNKHVVQNIPNWESVFLNANDDQKISLVPELLISTGKMVLNKTIRQLFRTHPPKRHLHIAENGFSADTFFTRPEVIRMAPGDFFSRLSTILPNGPSSYLDYFVQLSEIQKERSETLLRGEFNEFSAIRQLPDQLVLHLANSMAVRYVAYLASYLKPEWKLYSNRGVSGIDGCSSTAVGMSLLNRDLNILITGDIAFYYDINALWQNRLPENLRIVLLNNSGGGIFRNIDGPAGLPELDPFITTPHQFRANHVAEHFGLRYSAVSGANELEQHLPAFLEGPGMAILEIITDPDNNSNIFKQYKSIVL